MIPRILSCYGFGPGFGSYLNQSGGIPVKNYSVFLFLICTISFFIFFTNIDTHSVVHKLQRWWFYSVQVVWWWIIHGRWNSKLAVHFSSLKKFLSIYIAFITESYLLFNYLVTNFFLNDWKSNGFDGIIVFLFIYILFKSTNIFLIQRAIEVVYLSHLFLLFKGKTNIVTICCLSVSMQTNSSQQVARISIDQTQWSVKLWRHR